MQHSPALNQLEGASAWSQRARSRMFSSRSARILHSRSMRSKPRPLTCRFRSHSSSGTFRKNTTESLLLFLHIQIITRSTLGQAFCFAAERERKRLLTARICWSVLQECNGAAAVLWLIWCYSLLHHDIRNPFQRLFLESNTFIVLLSSNTFIKLLSSLSISLRVGSIYCLNLFIFM